MSKKKHPPIPDDLRAQVIAFHAQGKKIQRIAELVPKLTVHQISGILRMSNVRVHKDPGLQPPAVVLEIERQQAERARAQAEASARASIPAASPPIAAPRKSVV